MSYTRVTNRLAADLAEILGTTEPLWQERHGERIPITDTNDATRTRNSSRAHGPGQL